VTDVQVFELATRDRAYALSSWRESHKQTSACRRVPWAFYKEHYGTPFARILADGGTLALGAYRVTPDGPGELLGFLVATPGRRVDTLHWVQTRFQDAAGAHVRRQGVASKLIEAAQLGSPFVYTLRSRRAQGRTTLDQVLAEKLAARGVTAVYEPFQEWLK